MSEHEEREDTSASSLIGELRSLLPTPSGENWRKICSILEQARSAQDVEEILVPYCLDHMKRWPSHLFLPRHAPIDWIERVDSEEATSVYKLATHIELDSGQSALKKWLKTGRNSRFSKKPIGATGAKKIAKSKHFQNMSWFHFEGCQLGDKGIEFLLSSKHLSSSISTLDFDDNQAGAGAAEALVRCENLRSLLRLYMMTNELGDDGVEILCSRRAPWESLQSLYLGYNDLGPRAGVALGRNAKLANLRTLDVRHNRLGDEGIEGLFASPSFTSLDALSIFNNHFDLDGVRALAACDTLRNIDSLYIGGNDFSSEAFLTLCECAFTPSLEKFFLSSSHVGQEGAQRLATSDFGNVTRLGLTRTNLGEEGIEELMSAPWLEELELLYLGGNKIGSQGFAHLCTSSLPNLSTIDLSGNNLTDDDMYRLVLDASWFEQLTSMTLENNAWTASTISMMLQSCSHLLTKLDASELELGEGGFLEVCLQLVRHTNLKTLYFKEMKNVEVEEVHTALQNNEFDWKTVDLSMNRWGSGLVDALCAARGLPSLTDLDIRGNQIGTEAMVRLAESEALGALEVLRVDPQDLDVNVLLALKNSPNLSSLKRILLAPMND